MPSLFNAVAMTRTMSEREEPARIKDGRAWRDCITHWTTFDAVRLIRASTCLSTRPLDLSSNPKLPGETAYGVTLSGSAVRAASGEAQSLRVGSCDPCLHAGYWRDRRRLQHLQCGAA